MRTPTAGKTAPDDVALTTERLVMRRLGRAHLADLRALYADPEVGRFLKPLDDAGHVQRIEESTHMWTERGHGRAAIHEKETGRFLGRSGLQYWPEHDEVEVTWALRRDAWGHGFATEAALGWIQWGWEHLSVPYLTAYIAPENTASLSVAARLGMAVLRPDVQHDRAVLVFAAQR